MPAPPTGTVFSGGAALPQVSQLYSPLANQPQGSSVISRTPNQSLGPAFANALAPAIVAVAQKFDPLTATILTNQGCSKASSEFLNCCRLLIHHDPNVVLTDMQLGHPLSTNANLFPCQPTAHF